MMRRLELVKLHIRRFMLEAQIAHGQALLSDHRRRLWICYRERQKVCSRIATLTPADQLMRQIRSRT